MNDNLRDALRRFNEGDPNVTIRMPDVPATDETGQPTGVGVEITGDQPLVGLIAYLPEEDTDD